MGARFRGFAHGRKALPRKRSTVRPRHVRAKTVGVGSRLNPPMPARDPGEPRDGPQQGGYTGSSTTSGRRRSETPRGPVNGAVFASDAQSGRKNAIGEQNQVLALPSSARNNKAVEVKEMGRFPDFLHGWVLFIFVRVLQRSITGCFHAESFERRVCSAIQTRYLRCLGFGPPFDLRDRSAHRIRTEWYRACRETVADPATSCKLLSCNRPAFGRAHAHGPPRFPAEARFQTGAGAKALGAYRARR